MLSFFKRLFHSEALTGAFLLFCAGAALYASNSSFAALYKTAVNFPFSIDLGFYKIRTNVHQIINDGLMSLFFFVVGMEVKKELLHGELAAPRKAALSLLAACGGMIVPAALYWLFNKGQPTGSGWGVPMATDIAFAIGVLSLMSHKVPAGLKIFLLSLAIIDDIGAVLVIALFYGKSIHGPFLGLSCLTAFFIFLYFKLNLRNAFALTLLGAGLWLSVLNSGVHAALSGVIMGMLIPGSRQSTEKQALDSAARAFRKKPSAKKVREISQALKEAHSPLDRLISFFHPLVVWLIMPLFAFFNAGLALERINPSALMSDSVFLGVFTGLFLGKPLGVALFAYCAVLAGVAELPQNVKWRHITAVGFLAGVGFTMSLFISNLSFGLSGASALSAKASVLSASCLAACAGLIILLFFTKTVPKSQR